MRSRCTLLCLLLVLVASRFAEAGELERVRGQMRDEQATIRDRMLKIEQAERRVAEWRLDLEIEGVPRKALNAHETRMAALRVQVDEAEAARLAVERRSGWWEPAFFGVLGKTSWTAWTLATFVPERHQPFAAELESTQRAWERAQQRLEDEVQAFEERLGAGRVRVAPVNGGAWEQNDPGKPHFVTARGVRRLEQMADKGDAMQIVLQNQIDLASSARLRFEGERNAAEARLHKLQIEEHGLLLEPVLPTTIRYRGGASEFFKNAMRQAWRELLTKGRSTLTEKSFDVSPMTMELTESEGAWSVTITTCTLSMSYAMEGATDASGYMNVSVTFEPGRGVVGNVLRGKARVDIQGAEREGTSPRVYGPETQEHTWVAKPSSASGSTYFVSFGSAGKPVFEFKRIDSGS